jgi:hypothetical protein
MLTDLHQKAIWSIHFNNKCKYKILSSSCLSRCEETEGQVDTPKGVVTH